jgi:hypothetical protein
VASHKHPAAQCPLENPQGKAMIKQLFTDENVKKAEIKIVGAYVSCPREIGSEHKGFFTVEADTAAAVVKFFGPMTVEVRPVVPFSEVAKTMQNSLGIFTLYSQIVKRVITYLNFILAIFHFLFATKKHIRNVVYERLIRECRQCPSR